MSGRLTFLRRTPKEVEVYGGEVFFDIDGRNVGKLASVDCFVDLPAGRHTIRMYKSHNYDMMIGFADVIIDLREGEHLLIRYTPPMIANQPGHIIVEAYSAYAANAAAQQREQRIYNDQRQEAERRERSSRGNRAAITWIIIGSVSAAILIALSYLWIWSPIFW